MAKSKFDYDMRSLLTLKNETARKILGDQELKNCK